MPLIESDNTFALTAVIMVITAVGMWAERTRWGQQLGGPLLLIAIAMLLANVGVIPHSAPLYDSVMSFLVPLAIPLLLMRADLRTIIKESGPMLVAFLVAVGATVAGSFAGAVAIDMGPLEPQIAGTVTASYIGGSLNFVATAEAVGIRDSSIYVAALSADAAGAVFFLLALMLLPAVRFVQSALPSKFVLDDRAGRDAREAIVQSPDQSPFNLAQATNGLAVSLVVCAVSAWLAELLKMESLYILIVTILALLIANFGKSVIRNVSSEFEIGTLFMYLFFACIGAGANLSEVLGAALPILSFIFVMVIVHLCLIVLIGKLIKLDLAEVMIASNACILGPAPAAALAASKGWHQLVAPGILVGMFGYAIATFIGVAIAALLGF
jgi:uncharacterized membrane protein